MTNFKDPMPVNHFPLLILTTLDRFLFLHYVYFNKLFSKPTIQIHLFQCFKHRINIGENTV
jgi:hypothetical protein